MPTVTVDDTISQLPTGGADSVTVVNNDLFTDLTVSTTYTFVPSNTVTVSPLSSATLVIGRNGAVYAQAKFSISVTTIPGGHGYNPGSIITLSTAQNATVNLSNTGLFTSDTILLFTCPRNLSLENLNGTVYLESNSGTGTVTSNSFTFETNTGLVIESGTNWTAGKSGSSVANTFQYTNVGITLTSGTYIYLVLTAASGNEIQVTSGSSVNLGYL